MMAAMLEEWRFVLSQRSRWTFACLRLCVGGMVGVKILPDFMDEET
jgi:hypothetical protein